MTETPQPAESADTVKSDRDETPEADHLIVAIHGILTGRTDPAWPVRFRAWAFAYHPEARIVQWPYYELPFPRVAARRNRRRVEQITRAIDLHIDYLRLCGRPWRVSLVGHSNGGYLIHQIARYLIDEQGIAISRYVTSAPAVPAGPTTVDVARWIAGGHLGAATLIRAGRDRLLRLVDHAPRLVTWPWGALGHSGWHYRGHLRPIVGDRIRTIDLPQADHAGFLSRDTCADTFREHIWPALDRRVPLVTVGRGYYGETAPDYPHRTQ